MDRSTYLGSIDVGRLYRHVVQRTRDCPCSYCTSIPARDGDDDCMRVRLGINQGCEDPAYPVVSCFWQHLQRDQARQDPKLTDHSDEESLIQLLR